MFDVVTTGLQMPAVSQAVQELILNLSYINYFDTQQMFLNVFKQSSTNGNVYSAWTTINNSNADTSEEAYLPQVLNLGYPMTLTLPTPPSGGQLFTKLQKGVFVNMAETLGLTNRYPVGNWRWQFEGKCTFTLYADLTVPAQTLAAGLSVNGLTGSIPAQGSGAVVQSTNAWGTTNTVLVANSVADGAGFGFRLSALPDSSNYYFNASLVFSAYTSLFDSGQIFNPDFIKWLKLTYLKPGARFFAIRFKDMLNTDSCTQNTRYGAYNFVSNPTAGQPLPALASGWPLPTGTRRIVLDSSGEEILTTFTTGSTAVSSAANPTVTCTNPYYHYFAYDSWTGRPVMQEMSWATLKGVPLEVCFELSNLLGSNPWINSPSSFQSSDWQSLAALCQSNVQSPYVTFVEFTNETWNTNFNQYPLMVSKSIGLFGSSDPGSYIGAVTAQMADAFATAAGNPGFDNQFIILMAGQAANTGWLTAELRATSWVALGNTAPYLRRTGWGTKTVKGVTIAPYVGNGPIWAADFTLLQAQADGGYTDFFAQQTQNPTPSGNSYHDSSGNLLPAGGWNAISLGYVTATVAAIASLGALPIYGYEGGNQFLDQSNVHGQAAFLTAWARDARQAQNIQTLHATIASGGMVPCHLNFCDPYTDSSGGATGFQWGLIENPYQTFTPFGSSPPKYQGAVNYIING